MQKVVAAFAILLQVVQLLTSATSPLNVDPKYIDIIDDRFYYFSSIGRNIPDAIDLCTEINMTLVALETQQEFDAVNNYIATNLVAGESYWTSGTRQMNTWIWSSVGRKITYFTWGDDDPDFTDNTTQANLFIGFGLMWDYTPNTDYKFICEQL